MHTRMVSFDEEKYICETCAEKNKNKTCSMPSSHKETINYKFSKLLPRNLHFGKNTCFKVALIQGS